MAGKHVLRLPFDFDAGGDLRPDLVPLAQERGHWKSSHIVSLKQAWKDWSRKPLQVIAPQGCAQTAQPTLRTSPVVAVGPQVRDVGLVQYAAAIG